MNTILSTFKNKKVRYGSLSTLMVLIVVAILVIINLVAGRLDLTYDMTSNKTYTLTQESKDILKNIDKDVTIYALVQTGQENDVMSSAIGQMTYKELLNQYTVNNSHITLQYIDPYIHPQFAQQYQDTATQSGSISVGSVIVVSGDRHRILSPNDLVSVQYDQNYSPSYTINIEPQVTNAITYVTSDVSAKVYATSGSNETALPDSLISQISMAGYDNDTVDITTTAVPDDCDVLFVTQPARDWNQTAADNVTTYLQNGGRAIFAVSNNTGVDMPNLNSVLQSYGIEIGKYLVIEGNQNNIFASNPLYVLPNFETHDITKDLTDHNYHMVLIQNSGVDTLDLKKESITVEPLLETSADAYGKTDPDNATTVAKEAGDVDGPITLAAAITDSYYTDVQHTTKLVVIASASIVSDQVNAIMNGANYLFLVDSMNWLEDKDNTAYIPTKSPQSTAQLTMTSSQTTMVTVLSAVVIPLVILAIGLIVWLGRRHN